MKKNLVGRLRARREIEVRKDVERRIADAVSIAEAKQRTWRLERIAEAVAAEREACASMARRWAEVAGTQSQADILNALDAAIRARSNPNKALDKGTGGGSDT